MSPLKLDRRTSIALVAMGLTMAFRPAAAEPFYRTAPVSSEIRVQWGSTSFAFLDANQDRKADLVAANDYLDFRLGIGDGTFSEPATRAYSGTFEHVATGDLNQDGFTDVIARWSSGWAFLLSQGNGLWHDLTKTWIWCPNAAAPKVVADMDGNGYPDLVGASSDRNMLSVQHFYSNLIWADSSRVTFEPHTNTPRGVQFVVGDVNDDGFADVVGASPRGCLIMHGLGSWAYDSTRTVGPGGSDIVSGDFNGDARMDVASGRHLYLNQAGELRHGGEIAADVRVADDIDGDGFIDLVGHAGDSILVFMGNGDGSFTSSGDLIRINDPEDIQLADVNGDGWLDLGVSDRGTGLLHVYLTSMATHIDTQSTPKVVQLEWQVTQMCESAITVERREASGPWSAIGTVSPVPNGRVAFTDEGVGSGHSYSYRLAWTCSPNDVVAGEVSVAVPEGTLALGPPRPNPAITMATLELVMARDGRASMDIIDLSGRRVATNDLGVLSGGLHQIPIASLGMLRAGIYHVVVRLPGEIRSTKLVIAR